MLVECLGQLAGDELRRPAFDHVPVHEMDDLAVTQHHGAMEGRALVREAVQAEKPFLGICRGFQVINVALGGTLLVDIAARLDAVELVPFKAAIAADSAMKDSDVSVTTKDGVVNALKTSIPETPLWYALNLYFKNGGSRCYVLSVKTIGKAGYELGKQVFIAMDAASTEFYDAAKKVYTVDGKQLSPAAMVDLLGVGAHYAITALFRGFERYSSIYAYEVDLLDSRTLQAGRMRVALGRADIRSRVTWHRSEVTFGVLHLGDNSFELLPGSIKAFWMQS